MMTIKHPTVDVPPWSTFEDPTAGAGYPLPVSGVISGSVDYSPYMLGEVALAALQRYLPCNDSREDSANELDVPVDAYSCDDFRMYEFKVRRCTRDRAHDWTECPYAHPGEKARRRDPGRYQYSGAACPHFRMGNCKRGDACGYAHGVFECWLHPARYHTQPCKDGTTCRRRVCFFAHTSEQLRLLPQQQQQSSPKAAALSPAIESYDGSPLRQQALESFRAAKHYRNNNQSFSSTPNSTLMSPPMSPPSRSPPVTPNGAVGLPPFRLSSWPASGVNEIVAPLRQLQLSKSTSAPISWSLQLSGDAVFGPSKSAVASPVEACLKSGFCSLPATPTTASSIGSSDGCWFDGLEGVALEEHVERVESGRALRAKMFERLSKDCILEKAGATSAIPAPDVAWVSELVM